MAFDRERRRATVDAGSILIVSDDARTDAEFGGLFAAQGYDVQRLDPVDADALDVNAGVDLVIYDERASPGRAIGFCRSSVVRGGAPIILISDEQDAVSEIVALEVGADEVVSTPIEGRLLLARVRAMLRRARLRPAPREAGDALWTLDAVSRTATSPHGRRVELAPHQIRLMRLFLDHPGDVLTPERIARLDPGLRMEAAAFRTALSRLRRRLQSPGESDFIRVVRGSGYVHQP